MYILISWKGITLVCELQFLKYETQNNMKDNEFSIWATYQCFLWRQILLSRQANTCTCSFQVKFSDNFDFDDFYSKFCEGSFCIPEP